MDSESKHLREWLDSITSDGRSPVNRRTEVTGAIDRHCGPTWQRARVEAVAEPSAQFCVEIAPDAVSCGVYPQFITAAIAGVIEALVAARPLPCLGVKLLFTAFLADPVASSEMAFREAGFELGCQLTRSGSSHR